jgi:hypothetical protein
MSSSDSNQPHLKRVLGRRDLVLLFVVAVFNLNVVPSIAANGGVTIWLWLISLLLFFWPLWRLPRLSFGMVLLDE